MRIVNLAIDKHRYIQDQILARIEDDRTRLERIAYEEAEKLRRINMEKLENERLQIIRMHDDREKALYDQLNRLDRDEEERRRNRQPLTQEVPVHNNYEHFADGDADYSTLSQQQIHGLLADLFGTDSHPLFPIEFKP
jgi:hypothetical protein